MHAIFDHQYIDHVSHLTLNEIVRYHTLYHYCSKHIMVGSEPPLHLVFGLGGKHSMVIVEVIMVGSEPTVMAPQHRRIGQ